MSRHRNIRQMNYEEEYADYYNDDDYDYEEEEEEERGEGHLYDRSRRNTDHVGKPATPKSQSGCDATDGKVTTASNRSAVKSGKKAGRKTAETSAGECSNFTKAVSRLPQIVACEATGDIPSASASSNSPKVNSSETVKQKSKIPSVDDHVQNSALPSLSENGELAPTIVQEPIKSRSEAEVLAAFERERGSSKDHVNMVVIGHVDAGKSTLMGCLLHRLGYVSQKAMHKLETETQKLGKQSFKYAWLMDETDEERCRGVTMDVAQVNFETSTKSITVLDAPGHRDFIPNMITGAAAADVALLVVNAARGEFETGFDKGGQTREHAALVRSLGVSQLLIAINKLDTVDWSKERFGEIRDRLAVFLRSVGFRPADLSWVPCSGLSGANLATPGPEELTRWYSGPSLIQAIDEFRVQLPLLSLPVRASIVDVFRSRQQSSLSLAVRLESGMICVGDRLILMPCAETVTVKHLSVEGDSNATTSAFSGDHVTLSVTGSDLQMTASVGCVLCQPGHLVAVSSRIHVRLVVFEVDMPVTRGLSVEVHVHTLCVPGIVTDLLSQLHRSAGRLQRRHPRHLAANSGGELVLELSRPVCVTLYAEFRAYGRVTLRSDGRTVAAGVVTKVN